MAQDPASAAELTEDELWETLDQYFGEPPSEADGWLTTRRIAEHYQKTTSAINNKMARMLVMGLVEKVVVGREAYWRMK